MRFKHTNRKGFWLGFIDFFTAGLFFLVYIPCVLQDELDAILGYRTQRYYIAYLLGLPTLTVYTIVWMARIAEVDWNVFGLLLGGPAIATYRFFDTLNKIERELNRRNQTL